VTRRWAGVGIAVSIHSAILLGASVGAGPPTRIAAHRGGAALAAENSLTAFRGALALGVDALELDVHLSADGEPVVVHDATLERTTTGHGAVGDATLAQLRALRVKARDGGVTTDTVPTLAEVLDLAAPSAAEVLPEIKTAAGGRRYPGIEDKVLALLGARRFGERATIQAFDEVTIRRLHELDPVQRTMLLVSPRRLQTARAEPPEAVRWASAVGASDLGLDHRAIDARVVAAARAARVRLSAWTVNAEPDLRRLLDLGVDVVMSDHPDLALRLAGRAPRKP
jgi:glycerophosphoryl diester phosphodiesterase